ncbi:MAG: pyruvate, phosphate dikinase [Solirubrobacteraceae bacterium]
MSAVAWVQDFAEGSREQRDLLGGKGANVAEMTRILGADRVPAGFTITTEACVAYMHAERVYPEGLAEQTAAALERLEQRTGKRLGDDADPLLVSVRSGARESMPGMMDTVLNLGLNDVSVEGLAERTGNPRFAWDSYRRFVQMYGNVVEGVPSEAIEERIAALKRERGVTLDTDLDAGALRELVLTFKELYRQTTGRPFPQDPQEQLDGAIRAVFDSWTGERAVHYRRINRIPDDWGTAVNVQQMVFGNKGDTSCSGVAFSRDEVTGEPAPSGDFLLNAQGEDVVSGVRNTQDLAELADVLPGVHGELLEILRTLERHYGDLQDTEFTVEEGRLYMLQTRNAKRPAQAAVRFAVDAVEEGLLTREQALLTLDAAALETLLHPTFDRSANYTVLGTGVNASPGAAKGAAVFTAEEAVHAAQRGERVILVRPFTEADDVAGFHAAQGILTSEGGKASHAALVARGMGKPCVCGATALQVDLPGHVARIGDVTIREGDLVAINGTTGEITTDDVPLVEPSQDPAMAPVLERFETVLQWADDLRVLGVRTNADTPEDAAKARELGAEGIGLCRTEHMFMEADRQPKMRRMIMAEHEAERRAALEELRPLQQQDFEGLFEAMAGQPVTIRLLDPPLHEFLPKKEEVGEELHEAYAHKRYHRVGVLADVLERIETLSEANPMLGTRGVRLGLLYPEIFEMQAEAIFAAHVAVRERAAGGGGSEAGGAAPGGGKAGVPSLEVMIPLVGYERELEIMRGFVVAVADRHGLTLGEDYLVGTMIELPRACFLADAIADHADFFSFGTNDLTQTGLGFSRDDIEGKILARYIEFKILDRSPFETIDTPGVGQMLRMGAWLGRKTKQDLKLGVCGEHGGDPDSIAFFHDSGIDYVSCSPFRVPIARVAAAQAAVRIPRG